MAWLRWTRTRQHMLTDSTAHFTNRLVKLGRGQVKQVIALITGHGHFRKHLLILGITSDVQEC